MAVDKWKVAVISTDYNLHDVRAALCEHIASLGFEVLAFERSGFPVEPGVHPPTSLAPLGQFYT